MLASIDLTLKRNTFFFCLERQTLPSVAQNLQTAGRVQTYVGSGRRYRKVTGWLVAECLDISNGQGDR